MRKLVHETSRGVLFMPMKIWNEYDAHMSNTLVTYQEIIIKFLEDCYSEGDNWIFVRIASGPEMRRVLEAIQSNDP